MSKGTKFTEEHKNNIRNSMKGKRNALKEGKRKNSQGYIIVFLKGKYVFEHRLVAEKKLGRHLKPSEIVHHINGIRDDNRPENLIVLVNNSVHSKVHGNRYTFIQHLQQKIRELEKRLM